ncbi:MAG TPA: DNA recombination protein RmuC [Saprospiraceae bacterium]|nr:DNA recombination protein RmuC [Saprospiraceae bacterium]
MEIIYGIAGVGTGLLFAWLTASLIYTRKIHKVQTLVSEEKTNNRILSERLETQKAQAEELARKFNTEFENIANRVLDAKTEKFTKQNKENLAAILDPLGKNIEDFKKIVNETYDKESKERFSLGKEVTKLAQLNQQISQEASNLTRALKGESKTRGRWGELILETVLEKSGLRKDEEYFMEHQLVDEEGKPLRSDSEGKKMRPDAIIKYPDNREVLIDSKVSLNAYLRFMDATDLDEQEKALAEHTATVRKKIDELSEKGYDDYSKTLDFVMMFIPSEPAYIAAIQREPDLWNYAYDKRILLVNPTNLITSVKLIADLWKRERQNRNIEKIVDRGSKMYDKFVGFIENMQTLGNQIDKAREAYGASFSQLSTGKDNLVLQATKLQELGIKNKKDLSKELKETASDNELSD